MNYGLLGIITLLPFVSPLSVRAEDTPEAAIIETAEVGGTEQVTSSLPPPSEGGGAAASVTADELSLVPTQMPAGVASNPTGEPPLLTGEGDATDVTVGDASVAPTQAPPSVFDPCSICPIPVVAITPPPVPEPIVPTVPIVPVQVIPAPAVTPVPTPAPALPAPSSIPTSPTPIPTSYPVGSVLINEFVSDPADSVEWIELVNTTEDEISLGGWTVKDATTAKTALPDQLLPAHAFFVLQNPKGKLNNDGDSIFLFDGTGTTIDAISYDKKTAPSKGKSLARQADGSWIQSSPTPLTINSSPVAPSDVVPTGEPSISGGEITNTITYETTNNTAAAINPDTATQSQTTSSNPDAGTPSPVRVELTAAVEERLSQGGQVGQNEQLGISESPRSPTSPLAPSIPVIDASEIMNYAAGDTVTVDGVLVATPGTFGKQLAYIDGLEIYYNKADWPKLSHMTRVRVTGTVDVKTDYTRLKIKKRSDIRIVGPDAIAPDALESLDDARHGLLMSLTGSVADVSGKNLTIGLENGELIVATGAKDASVDFSDLAYDDRIAVTGVVRLIKGSWTLTILDQSGLTVLNDSKGTSSTTLANTSGVETPALAQPSMAYSRDSIVGPTKTKVPWLGGGLLTTSLGALGYWFAKAKGITLPLTS